MYCMFIGRDCVSSISCQTCSIWQTNMYQLPLQNFQYKYKCICGGEFNEPSMDGCNGYVCPFCGKRMRGIK